ncbi:hypothetical protein HD806DRAFT_551687 [Xylariaceae sp. AK1471]|nr:hypothetical protein HD806DRAFT_536007 [Xylariaceae sp. AK1471]KAI3326611.1 hypothetical protein HD806DRAFT_551687 [Xylariaceae sp. AK1471]
MSRKSWWTKQLSTIPFDNDIATELQRPAAVLEAYGLSIDHVAILDHHIDRHVNGWADHDVLCANVARAARELQHQVQQRQVNMPRLYAEFIAAFLTQRQQLEMGFVHTRVALREHRVPDAAWLQAMQAMVWKSPCSRADQFDLDTLVSRSGLRSEHRRDTPPFFIASKFGTFIDGIYLMLDSALWSPIWRSEWGREARYNHNTPHHQCIPLYQRWPVDTIHFSDAFMRFD